MTTLEGVDPQMIANNLKPFQPTHPGEVLKDELEYRGISQRGLVKEIGISYSVVNEMLNGKPLRGAFSHLWMIFANLFLEKAVCRISPRMAA